MSSIDSTVRDLFRLGSGWGNISGPGLFMTKAFLSGVVTALFFGPVGATSVAIVYGTAAFPFVVSASVGFAIGTIFFYRDTVSKALMALDRYPLLLRLHLQSNFPGRRFDLWDSYRFRSQEFGKDWVMRSMLAASYMSASSAIEHIHKGEEEAIVAHELERQKWKEQL